MAAQTEGKRRRVLIAVDGSENSERAFSWYCNQIHKQGDELYIIHAHELPALPAAPYPYGAPYYEEWQNLVQRSDSDARHLLELYGMKCKELKNQNVLKECDFKLYKETGIPGEIICKCAKDENCDLVIVGSRGLGTLRRTFVGSVSDYVVHHCSLPVAIVVPPNRHGAHVSS